MNLSETLRAASVRPEAFDLAGLAEDAGKLERQRDGLAEALESILLRLRTYHNPYNERLLSEAREALDGARGGMG